MIVKNVTATLNKDLQCIFTDNIITKEHKMNKVRITLTMRRVSATIVTVEKQKLLIILSVHL